MIAQILFSLFTFAVLSGLVLLSLSLIGCSIYDLVAMDEKNCPSGCSKTFLRRYRPLVSIVIPMFNESVTIEECLAKLRRLRYRKIEVIVADDKSTDNSRALVWQYIKAHPKQKIKLVCKRKNGGRGAAINLGMKHARGEILVAFDADCEFDKYAIHRLVEKFADARVTAVAANVKIRNNNYTVLCTLQKLEYLVSFRSKKFNSLTRSEVIIGGAGASYRMADLRAVKGFNEKMKTEDIELSMRMTRLLGKKRRLIYASDYVVYTDSVPTYRALFWQRYRWKFGSLQALYANRRLLFAVKRKYNLFTTLVRLPMACFAEFMLMLEPILITMFTIMAVVNKNPSLFISASCVYVMINWLAIWSDDDLARGEASYLFVISLFMYPASFIMGLVQVVAIFRTVVNWRGVVGLVQINGSYVTTERAMRK